MARNSQTVVRLSAVARCPSSAVDGLHVGFVQGYNFLSREGEFFKLLFHGYLIDLLFKNELIGFENKVFLLRTFGTVLHSPFEGVEFMGS